MAQLWRGGLLPPASVYPAQLHAPRDLLRRQRPLTHTRAALLAQVPQTQSPSHLPAMGTKLADQANRAGVAARLAEPAVPQSIEVARALLTYDAALLGNVARSILKTARHHDAHTLSRWPTVPGIATMLSLVRLSASHDLPRCPRGQECLSSGRLVQWSQASAGQRLGTSGAQIGHTHRQWAFAAAAGLCLRDQPAAPTSLARLEKNHDTGKAFTLLAQPRARAVYSRLKRTVTCDTETFVQRSGRGAAEPEASLDNPGHALTEALKTAACLASVHAKVPLGHPTLSPALCWAIRARSWLCAALVAHGQRVLLLTRAWHSLDNACALSPIFAEDGLRERRKGSVAEATRDAALQSSRT
jgi:hypothetical protein